MNPQVKTLIGMIRQSLKETDGLDSAVARVKENLETLSSGLSDAMSAELAEAKTEVSRMFDEIEILHRCSLIRKRSKWYHGPSPLDTHWPVLKEYLVGVKKWSQSEVDIVDETSNEIVSLLDCPDLDQYSCRGLVVGHVQSGKTANMTAVIAKAIDAGYNAVIILTGLTNKLRYQTQQRVINDLVSRNPLSWQVLTPTDIERDYTAPPYGGFMLHTDKAQLAIVKKNVSPLGQLAETIRRTPPTVMAKLKILVIDDECDQASVNSARKELDVTEINKRIRELISMIPCVSYVGYTATPFANVLINPYRTEALELDDLYPRDFITSLPRASSYFGTEQLFGDSSSDAEESEEQVGLDMIRTVPEEDVRALQPANASERYDCQPQMASSLEKSIIYFLACCAARHARGDGNQHMTMLVHTSAYVVMHERIADLISAWLDSNRQSLLLRAGSAFHKMEEIWSDESDKLPTGITSASKVSIDELFDNMPKVLDRITIPIENGASDDRIDYEGAPRTYIVVGGSILSRGLTLEGLIVSYFLRTANQYDTLLQMGRWFGYRKRYEDLPRIWMTEDMKLKFRALSAIEAEIRNEIDLYRIHNHTPMEIAVRIRAIPGMSITSANRMRSAKRCAISYWGTHRQTFRFEHQNSTLLLSNWAAAAQLVDQMEHQRKRAEGQADKLWRKVSKDLILEFISRYRVHASHIDLTNDLLLAFINGSDRRLDEWSVAIVEPQSAKLSPSPLGRVGNIRIVSRARLNDEGTVADIKALMSKSDVLSDCPKGTSMADSWEAMKAIRQSIVGQVPLLLLYAIDRDSQPRVRGTIRVPMSAVDDIMAFGIVFPGEVSESGSYVSVLLNPLFADDMDEIEIEESSQAEAAGVE